MCRLLGILSSAPVDFRGLLAERPRSLAALGAEHPDGWGLAAFGKGRWSIHKGVLPASSDVDFRARAALLRGDVLVSHVRKRTVGPTRVQNTHPFARDGWVFAHNGTVQDRAYLADRTSSRRRAELAGDTDSELFFAFLLSRLDARRLSVRSSAASLDAAISEVARECRRRRGFGSLNFLLSDGARCWAHRFGRELYLLERGPREGAPKQRTRAIFLASERMTGEPWREVPDSMLLRIERGPSPRVAEL